ncbi:sensor histidine kinase [Pokkaliibacter sp. CJK22405]|uniref:sensor histidine kinase n=1 Tax=Pokkaliibacter sp. CJK22405 TaxID=3384615 RepID=UPI00398528A9
MSLTSISLCGLLYVLGLSFLAWSCERGMISRRWLSHPAVYVLSLGVYASAWTFYGAVGLANSFGLGFLAAYIGAMLAFVLAPVIFIPIMRLCRNFQFSSMADLLAFRFRSRMAGVLTTFFMLVASIPLLAIQIQAVAESTQVLAPQVSGNSVAQIFCLALTLFAILFGARHPSIRDKQESLVFALAIKSLLKLIAMLAIGGYVLFSVFSGPNDLQDWLDIASLTQPKLLNDDAWRTLLLAFFASVIVMPHMFHIAFTENLNTRAFRHAAWGMPLFLGVLCLSIPLVIWAGMKLGLNQNPEYLLLYLGLNGYHPILTMLAFLGGIAAASGLMIVSVLAMAAMALNHLLLPVFQPNPNTDFYRFLLWSKRGLIISVILLSYLYYSTIGYRFPLYLQGLVAFIAFLQFLPGLLATLFWPRGHRLGFLWGLLTGMAYWLFGMLFPLIGGNVDAPSLSLYTSNWHETALWSLTLNIGIFGLLSVYCKPTSKEQQVAHICALNALPSTASKQVLVTNCQDFILCLTPHLGYRTAEKEVLQALADLNLEPTDRRPASLRRLRERLATNLSGLLGPTEAEEILDASIPSQGDDSLYKATDIHVIENQLTQYKSQLTGLAGELDSLRRFHRNILLHLPIGVCALGENQEIAMWNNSMVTYTGLAAEDVLGNTLEDLPTPWRGLLSDFIHSDEVRLSSTQLSVHQHMRWFSLQRMEIQAETDEAPVGEHTVILLEDETETKLLDDRLAHSERLISVGRLAAGVAHEIGNPVTAIACLAQNLKYETDKPELLEIAGHQLHQTDRISRIVQSLLSFSHSGQYADLERYEPLDLNDCIDEAIHLVGFDHRGKQIPFQNGCQRPLCISGDAQRLIQVFVNLFNNARDASPDGAPIILQSRMDDFSVQIDVIDQGKGIPSEALEHLFEPFFTTKEPGKGTGLGLSLVYSIIEEHYGKIEVRSRTADSITADEKTAEVHSGTCITLTLPRATPAEDSSIG